MNEYLHETLNFHISYYTRMQELSRVFKDRPMTPQQSIVYWTEYAIRHNGAPNLRALGTDMPLYKYLMLDIVALTLIFLSILVFVIHQVIKVIDASIKRRLKDAFSFKKLE